MPLSVLDPASTPAAHELPRFKRPRSPQKHLRCPTDPQAAGHSSPPGPGSSCLGATKRCANQGKRRWHATAQRYLSGHRRGSRPDAALVHILRRLISDAYLSRHRRRRPERLGHAEVIDHRPGTGWSSWPTGDRRAPWWSTTPVGAGTGSVLLSTLRPGRGPGPGSSPGPGCSGDQPGLRGVDGVRWIRGARAHPTTDLPNSANDGITRITTSGRAWPRR